MKKIALALIGLLLTASCGKPTLEGEWIQPVPGMEGQIQGIELEKGGKARSINMATLVYEKWHREGNQIVLHGKSIGNGLTIDFDDTYEISKLDETELILKDGDLEMVYKRKIEE